jgi:hypothetical protein
MIMDKWHFEYQKNEYSYDQPNKIQHITWNIFPRISKKDNLILSYTNKFFYSQFIYWCSYDNFSCKNSIEIILLDIYWKKSSIRKRLKNEWKFEMII